MRHVVTVRHLAATLLLFAASTVHANVPAAQAGARPVALATSTAGGAVAMHAAAIRTDALAPGAPLHMMLYGAAAPASLMPKTDATAFDAAPASALDLTTLLCVGLGLLLLSATQGRQEKFSA